MGEIKGQLLGIVAVVVTFGIVSGALFIAFDTLSADVANDITSKVEYKTSSETTTLAYGGFETTINNSTMMAF